MLEQIHNPTLQAAAKLAVEARPARPSDSDEVLVSGKDFYYLGCDVSGEPCKFPTAPNGAPTRVVVDAIDPSTTSTPPTMTWLAIRERDDLLIKINPFG